MSATARSPLSGCTILILAVLMLVFLIGFSIWTPFRQATEIEKFTKAEPEPLPVLSLETEEMAARSLQERFERFRSDISDEEKEARIELDAKDLNLAVAMFPALEELRRSFLVRSIENESLVIDICYQLNGRPRLAREGEEGPVTADPRYLVGTIHGHPLLTKRELVLKVDRLDVPGAEVAEGFMGHFSTLRIFEKSLKDPEIGPVMAKLTQASLDGDKLVLARIPGDPVPDVVPDEVFQKTGSKIALFLGGAAVIFILLAGTVLYVGYRKQLQKLQESEETNEDSSDA
ncbi:hypothetical protein [Haloferula sp.]|uniref:hypothetical protein n=1 Tax=Haloferula sp. TaxID=2497595 RepID=UPI00329E3477